jgi:hypothetical protein
LVGYYRGIIKNINKSWYGDNKAGFITTYPLMEMAKVWCYSTSTDFYHDSVKIHIKKTEKAKH